MALLAAAVLGALQSKPVAAQSVGGVGFHNGEGTVRLVDWPDEQERRSLHYDILPFIDTLSVAYFYDVEQGKPVLTLRVHWIAGREAIYKGRRTPRSAIEGDILMIAVDLRAGVYVDGDRVAGMTVVVDSMAMGAAPDFVDIELPDLTWGNVFTDVSPEEAEDIFEHGFALRDLDIASAAFMVTGSDQEKSRTENPTIKRRPSPAPVSIYRAPHTADVFIDIFWVLGGESRLHRLQDGAPRSAVGRGSLDDGPRSRSGRSSADRGRDRDGNVDGDGDSQTGGDRDRRRPTRDGRDESDRSSEDDERSSDDDEHGSEDGERGGFRLPASNDDDDDDDDDDDKLVPYAIAAAGAAGLLAVAGGTIGYYGSSRHAPLGLTSGIVRRGGGLLLQVGVNEALLFDEDEPKRLLVKLLTFGNVFNAAIEPAFGAGVLATSEPNGEIQYDPSISVGAVGRFNALLLYAGYDILQNGPEFGAALNIRELAFWKNRDSKRD